MSILDTWKEWTTEKKILSIFAICCILAIILLVASGGIGSSGTQLKVSYDGSWSGVVVAGNSVKTVSGYGEQTIDLDCDTNDQVHTQISKMDDSSDNLKVQIIKGGQVAGEQTTSMPYGFVSITVD